MSFRAQVVAAGVVSFLVGGFVGGYFIYEHRAWRAKRIVEAWNSDVVEVVVANGDLEPGRSIQLTDLAVRKVPVVMATASAVTPETMTPILKMRLLHALKWGDTLLWTHVAAGAPEGLCETALQLPRERENEAVDGAFLERMKGLQ